jgi:hypothetical protein
MPNYIPDGYTEKVHVPKTEWYNAVQIEYRPALPEERAVLFRRIEILRSAGQENDIKAAEKLCEEAIKSHLTWWNLTHDGDVLPISLEVIHRLEPHFQRDIFDIVMVLAKGEEIKQENKEKN